LPSRRGFPGLGRRGKQAQQYRDGQWSGHFGEACALAPCDPGAKAVWVVAVSDLGKVTLTGPTVNLY